jgi:hypothetical protein
MCAAFDPKPAMRARYERMAAEKDAYVLGVSKEMPSCPWTHFNLVQALLAILDIPDRDEQQAKDVADGVYCMCEECNPPRDDWSPYTDFLFNFCGHHEQMDGDEAKKFLNKLGFNEQVTLAQHIMRAYANFKCSDTPTSGIMPNVVANLLQAYAFCDRQKKLWKDKEAPRPPASSPESPEPPQAPPTPPPRTGSTKSIKA